MKWIAFCATIGALATGAADAATVQLDATASDGVNTASVTAVFDTSATPSSTLSTGHRFPAAALVSATYDWVIGGVAGSFSYAPGSGTNDATIQQFESSSFDGVGQQILWFTFNCAPQTCTPFNLTTNLNTWGQPYSGPSDPDLVDVLWSSTDKLLDTVLDGNANNFDNYITDDGRSGESYIAITLSSTATKMTLTSAVWSDPNDPGDPDPGVVPLPAGLPLLLAGLGAFGLLRRRA